MGAALPDAQHLEDLPIVLWIDRVVQGHSEMKTDNPNDSGTTNRDAITSISRVNP